MTDLADTADRRAWAAALLRRAYNGLRVWLRRRPALEPVPSTTPTPEAIAVVPVAPPAADSVKLTAPEQRAPSLRGLRRDIKDRVEEIIDLFARSERVRMGRDSARTYVDAHNELNGCDYHLVDHLAERMEGADRWYLIGDDAADQVDAMWPVDIACIGWKKEWAGYFTNRLSTASPSDVRGKTRLVPPKIAIMSSGRLIPDAPTQDAPTWTAENTICGLIGGKWTEIGDLRLRESRISPNGDTIITMRSPSNPIELNNAITMMLAAALTARYSWHVAFGSEPGPRLVLPTNPTGCVALFRDREKIESGRRNALRHWVANHYRDNSHTNADIIYVRDHLRGATRFVWRGLSCEILVSQYDLEKNEFFKAQAAEWRSQRKHNRVRLRIKERRQS